MVVKECPQPLKTTPWCNPQWGGNCNDGDTTRHNEEAHRAWEGGGVNDEGGGWAIVPILQNGSVFFLLSLYYTDINYSTTDDSHYCQQM